MAKALFPFIFIDFHRFLLIFIEFSSKSRPYHCKSFKTLLISVQITTLVSLLPTLSTLSSAEIATAHEISAYHAADTLLNEEIAIVV